MSCLLLRSVACALVVLGSVPASLAQAPPAPPNVVKFPKSTNKAAVPKIIRLQPGQKRITSDQLKKTPTADKTNNERKVAVKKPAGPIIPGAPKILRGMGLPSRAAPANKPAPKAAVKAKPAASSKKK